MGAGFNDLARTVIEDGNFLVVGGYTFNALPYVKDFTVWKLDGIGNVVWQYQQNSPLDGECWQVINDRNGDDYVACGYITSALSGTKHALVIKLFADGSEAWGSLYPLGTYGHNYYARSICLDPNGGYFMTGIGNANDTSRAQLFLAKMDTIGTPGWSALIGNTLLWNAGCKVYKVANDGYVVAGYRTTEGNDVQGMAWRFDDFGSLLWEAEYGGGLNDYLVDVCQGQQDGGFTFAGYSASVGWESNYSPWLVHQELEVLAVEPFNKTASSGDFSMIASPNPFNPITAITYNLTSPSRVTLTIFDLTGREVATLVDGTQPAGIHEVRFNGGNLPSSIYFARLTGNNQTSVKKLVLAK